MNLKLKRVNPMNPRSREPTRRELRAGSRRARDRATKAKFDEFLRLREEGLSTGVMASSLGMSSQTVDELLAIVRDGVGGQENNA